MLAAARRVRLALLAFVAVLAAACSGGVTPAGNLPPTVSFIAPSDGAPLMPGAPLVLVARVDDPESPLDALTLDWRRADGSALAGTPTRAGDVVTLELPTGLPGPVERITLTATDPQGASGADTLTLGATATMAPTIDWATPVEGSTNTTTSPIEVSGRVADADTGDLRTLALAWEGSMDLAGAPGNPDAAGGFGFTLPALAPGPHFVRLTVTDADGGTASLWTDFRVVMGAMGTDDDGDGVATPDDCDDTDPTVRPGAAEVVGDGIDQDCDGGDTCFTDADGDGFAAVSGTLVSLDLDCDDLREAPASAPRTDCNDTNFAAYPGAEEIPGNERDDDCDGGERCFVDADDDGRRTSDATATVVSADADCSDPGEISGVSTASDCNDADPRIAPGLADAQGDGIDTNCDGFELCYVDSDDDGYVGDPRLYIASSDADCDDRGEAYATQPRNDCNDGDVRTYPGAAERCDGLDNDCDGVADAAETSDFILVAAGPLTSSTTWSRTDREYCLTGTVTVLAGVTLRATEGVRIGALRPARNIVIEGRIEFEGTSAQPIALTNLEAMSGASAGTASLAHVRMNEATVETLAGELRGLDIGMTRASSLRGTPLLVDGLTADAGCAIPVRRTCRVNADATSSIDHAVLEQSELYLFGGGTVANTRMNGGELVFWPSPSAVPTPARTIRDSVFTEVRWYDVSGITERISLAGLVLERNLFEGLDVSPDRLFIDGPGVIIRNNHFGTFTGPRLFEISTGAAVLIQHNTFLSTTTEILRLSTAMDAGAGTDARENYWGTTEETVIQARIYDRSDASSLTHFIFVNPYLTAPHPDTPVP